jgi:ubiquinone/menaquinone biosynthesis C-methylase UbiE
MNTKTHWENIYSTKAADAVSWYQSHPVQSLRLIRQVVGDDTTASIIDVGGGASTLVDHLLDAGFTDVTVLDISANALASAQARLQERARRVAWLEADVLALQMPSHPFDVWHDRAVFHFLTAAEDRRRYVQAVHRAVKPGGSVIVATFAEDGPSQCSGLDVARYSADQMHAAFGAGFKLITSTREDHHTPFGTVQKFIYCLCRKEASGSGLLQ